jgi:hypothetical protein
MTRARRCLLLAGVGLLAWCPSALAAHSPICTRGLTTVERDPRALLPLTGSNPIGAAVAAALRFERPSARPQVRGATLAIEDASRGAQAKFSCGTRVWQRTVVVYVLDRAMLPAASASQRVYFVGRFAEGYRVWQIVH